MSDDDHVFAESNLHAYNEAAALNEQDIINPEPLDEHALAGLKAQPVHPADRAVEAIGALRSTLKSGEAYSGHLEKLAQRGIEAIRDLEEQFDAIRSITPEELARRFHEAYEQLAPKYQYLTRPESAVEWDGVPQQNRALMCATAGEVLLWLRGEDETYPASREAGE